MSDFELTLPSRDLKAVLARAAGAAQAKSSMAVLASCLLEAKDGALQVTTTDLFVTERSSVAATVKKAGSLCVDARKFTDMAKQLPVGDVKLRMSGTSLEVSCVKSKYKLPSSPAADFPAFPSADKAVPIVSLASDVMLQLIAQGAYAGSTDDTRPHLCGMLLETDKDVSTVVSTDGHRLALAKVQAPHGPACKVLVPSKGVAELKKLCASADQVELRSVGNLLIMSTADTTVTATTTGEQFPPYSKVIPQNHTHRVTLQRDALVDAVRRVAVVAATTQGGGIRLEFDDGELSIHAESAEVGEAHETVECDRAFKFKIGVNASYLSQALSAQTSDEVTLDLVDSLSPVVVRSATDEGAIGVVMPMRID